MSKSDEWYTGEAVVSLLHTYYDSGIDLDPASNAQANELILADNYYSEEDNGLEQPWFGKVWCNPPYSRQLIGPFVEKFLTEPFAEGILLVNANEDTQWFRRLVDPAEEVTVLFSVGRLPFYSHLNQSYGKGKSGSAIFYKGKNHKRFKEVFTSTGMFYEIKNPKC